MTTSLIESGYNSSGTISVNSLSTDHPSVSSSGNSVTGVSSFTQAGSASYDVWQTQANGADGYTLDASGTQDYTRTGTASAVTGEVSTSETGSDGYTLEQSGTLGTRTYTLQVLGTDAYTTVETSNTQNGGFTRSLTGTDSFATTETGDDAGVPFSTSNSGSNSFGQTNTGNYVDGAISLSSSGTTRYGQLEGFNNASDPGSGTPGDVDFSPVGAAFVLGTGPGLPTGGGSFAGSQASSDALSGNAAGAAGSQLASNVRGNEAAGMIALASGQSQAGVGALAKYWSQSQDWAHKYCFARGTLVLLADGTAKAIETIEVGTLVLASPDNDPEAPPTACKVLQVFHNDPARIFEVHVGEPGENGGGAAAPDIIRSTANHPFYVQGKGWVKVQDLKVSDLLKSHTGRYVAVQRVVDSGKTEPVFNLQVEKSHTYFVTLADGNGSVLVHNDSVDAGPVDSEGQPKGMPKLPDGNEWKKNKPSTPGGRIPWGPKIPVKSPTGSQPKGSWDPSLEDLPKGKPEGKPHWDVDWGDGKGTEHYDEDGNVITPKEAHPFTVLPSGSRKPVPSYGLPPEVFEIMGLTIAGVAIAVTTFPAIKEYGVLLLSGLAFSGAGAAPPPATHGTSGTTRPATGSGTSTAAGSGGSGSPSGSSPKEEGYIIEGSGPATRPSSAAPVRAEKPPIEAGELFPKVQTSRVEWVGKGGQRYYWEPDSSKKH